MEHLLMQVTLHNLLYKEQVDMVEEVVDKVHLYQGLLVQPEQQILVEAVVLLQDQVVVLIHKLEAQAVQE